MKDDVTPLSAKARAMLDIERRRPDVSSAISGRVLDRLATSVAIGTGGGGGSGSAEPRGGGTPGGGTTGGAATGSVLGAKTLAIALGAFVAGSGVGAAVHASLTSRAPTPVVASAAPATAAATSAPPSEEAPSVDIAIARALPLPPSSSTAPARSRHLDEVAAKDVDLARERALIERARMALARGDHGAALEALDLHVHDFPRGRLVEEREALAIQALSASGRTAEARERATRFRRQFPTSVFLPTIDGALR